MEGHEEREQNKRKVRDMGEEWEGDHANYSPNFMSLFSSLSVSLPISLCVCEPSHFSECLPLWNNLWKA